MKKINKTEERVEKILAQIRPYIHMHGGEVALQNFKAGVVTLKVSGACADCSLSDLTYNKMIGSIIKEEVPEVKDLIIEN